jgi:hypothetical protein
VSASRKQRPAPARAVQAKAGPANVGPAKAGSAKAGGGKAVPGKVGSAKARPATAARPAAARSGQSGGRPGVRQPAGPGVVVGPVPVLARIAGGLAVAGALVRLVAAAFPLASTGGRDLAGGNAFDWIVLLPFAGAAGAAGVLCLLGRLPRLGLAVLLPIGSAAAGLLLRTAYLLDDTNRSSQDLPLGLGSSFRYEAGGGLWLQVVAYSLLVAAFGAAAVAWSRTGMEDDGSFDGLRPRFAAFGLAAGIFAAIAVGMRQVDAIVPGAGAPPLLEQSGLAEAGGLVLAGALLCWGAVAPTLHPRLATVGAFVGAGAVLGTDGLASVLLARRSPVAGVGAGATAELLVAAAFGLLAVGAWRLSGRRTPAEPEDGPTL